MKFWLGLLLLSTWLGNAQVLYNIDFNAPGQTANSVVRTGAAPAFISAITAGLPTVASSFGTLTQQPLVLRVSSGVKAQGIQLNFTNLPILDLSFDLYVSGLVRAPSNTFFAIQFQGAALQGEVDFDNFGQIYAYEWPEPPLLGTFTNAESMHIDMHIAARGRHIEVYKDGGLMGSQALPPSFPYPPGIIALSLDLYGGSVFAPLQTAAVGIDNVIVSVPEPHLTGLALMASAAVAWRKSRMSRASSAAGLRPRLCRPL